MWRFLTLLLVGSLLTVSACAQQLPLNCPEVVDQSGQVDIQLSKTDLQPGERVYVAVELTGPSGLGVSDAYLKLKFDPKVFNFIPTGPNTNFIDTDFLMGPVFFNGYIAFNFNDLSKGFLSIGIVRDRPTGLLGNIVTFPLTVTPDSPSTRSEVSLAIAELSGKTEPYPLTLGTAVANIGRCAKSFVEGDLDGDGQVTIRDVQTVLASLFGEVELSESAFNAADRDGNGIVNLADVRLLLFWTLFQK